MNGKRVTQAQLNHLRLLLGWIRTEIGPDAFERLQILQDIVDKTGPVTDAACQERVSESILKAHRVPRYVRNALKQLSKVVEGVEDGETVDSHATQSAQVTFENSRLRQIGPMGD